MPHSISSAPSPPPTAPSPAATRSRSGYRATFRRAPCAPLLAADRPLGVGTAVIVNAPAQRPELHDHTAFRVLFVLVGPFASHLSSAPAEPKSFLDRGKHNKS